MKHRIWEIDFLRGTAIVLMITFHFFYDLNFLGILPNAMYEGGWLLLQRVTITLFLLLVGTSIYLSYYKIENKTTENILKKFGKRALTLAAVALIITLATMAVVPQRAIVFGVIHLIALSTLLAIPFLSFNKLNLIVGAVLMAQSIFLPLPVMSTPWLLWLGFAFPGFSSLDYVPVIPWFGLILIGMYIGKNLYHEATSRIKQPTNNIFAQALQTMGRHSLLIYLAHQPIILALLLMFNLL